MKNVITRKPVLSCIVIFALCGAARFAEYFLIRTDGTVLAENFLHKVFGILVMAAVLYILREKWSSIGFVKAGMASGIAKGLLLGLCCFLAAYSVECLMLYRANQNVSLAFYASGFALSGETVKHTGAGFVLLCVAFNIINVWMEEGVFRGLFMKLLTGSLPFPKAVLFTAFLFGIWHWVMPLRDYADGALTLGGLLVMGVGYIILAGIMSVKWSLLYQMTGALWTGLGDHLFNNVIVTNLLHVVSNGEADSMQIVRILIGQTLSFAVVVLCYRRAPRKAG